MSDQPPHALEIRHEEDEKRGAFFHQQGGRRLAELTYSRANGSLVIVDHTAVDPALAGNGVGRKLVDAAVEWARQTNTRIVSVCPFTTAQFEADPSLRDVLG